MKYGGCCKELPSQGSQGDVSTSKAREDANREVQAHRIQQEGQFQLPILVDHAFWEHEHERKRNGGEQNLKRDGKEDQRPSYGPQCMACLKPIIDQRRRRP